MNEKAVSMQNERVNLMRGESDQDDGIYETYDFGNKGRGDDELYETPYSDSKYETPYRNSQHEYAEYAQPNNKVNKYLTYKTLAHQTIFRTTETIPVQKSPC